VTVNQPLFWHSEAKPPYLHWCALKLWLLTYRIAGEPSVLVRSAAAMAEMKGNEQLSGAS
jgi:hypothetical protein